MEIATTFRFQEFGDTEIAYTRFPDRAMWISPLQVEMLIYIFSTSSLMVSLSNIVFYVSRVFFENIKKSFWVAEIL